MKFFLIFLLTSLVIVAVVILLNSATYNGTKTNSNKPVSNEEKT